MTRDNEVITLLNKLGARMVRNERDQLHLQNTIEQNQRSVLKLHGIVSRQEDTEVEMRQRQELLEQRLDEQSARVEKAALMADRLEEAMSQHAQISGRLEKMHQDRASMARKIERIEEAVIDTKEVLQSTSLILHNAANGGGQLPAELGLTAANDGTRKASPLQAVAMILLVTVSIIGGWFMSMVVAPQSFPFRIEGNFDMAQYFPKLRPVGDDDLDDVSVIRVATTETNTRSIDATPSFPKQEAPAYIRNLSPEDVNSIDVGAEPQQVTPIAAEKPVEVKPVEVKQSPDAQPLSSSDDEEMVATLNKADEMNSIEPVAGAATVSPQIEKEAPKKVTGKKPTPASFQPESVMAKNDPVRKESTKPAAPKQAPAPSVSSASSVSSVEQFLTLQRDLRPLADRVSRDDSLPDALKEVEDQAFNGMPEAQHDLAAIYTAGHGGVKIDYEKAAVWFKEAALNGIPNARYNLGVLHHQGLGVKQDVELAVGWYRAAADVGHAEALYNLGIAHIEAIGTAYNPRIAASYFERAANKGVMEAAYNLGLIYENGLLDGRKPKEALDWYKRAAALGSPQARTAVEDLAVALGYSLDDVNEMIDEEIARLSEGVSPAGEGDAKSATKSQSPVGLHKSSVPASVPTAPSDESLMKVSKAKVPSGADTQNDLISEIQKQLMRLGLYPGPVDGNVTPQMEDAIWIYQTRNDLPRTGKLSEELLAHMEGAGS
jgi:TPR repeat protein